MCRARLKIAAVATLAGAIWAVRAASALRHVPPGIIRPEDDDDAPTTSQAAADGSADRIVRRIGGIDILTSTRRINGCRSSLRNSRRPYAECHQRRTQHARWRRSMRHAPSIRRLRRSRRIDRCRESATSRRRPSRRAGRRGSMNLSSRIMWIEAGPNTPDDDRRQGRSEARATAAGHASAAASPCSRPASSLVVRRANSLVPYRKCSQAALRIVREAVNTVVDLLRSPCRQ